MALKFEFMQFEYTANPEYEVYDYDDESVGCIYFDGKWYFQGNYYGIDSSYLNEIANKLDELNHATQSQRILGVF